LTEAGVDELARSSDLVFDDAVARLVDAAVREGVFQPTTGPKERSTQAVSAATFMARLPAFPDAKVDELLDTQTRRIGFPVATATAESPT
jgi:hypothetical protein